MCERWLESFENFYADMGDPPEGMSIDRIDNAIGYSKVNCRWATASQQAKNKRSNKLEPHEPAQIRWLGSCGYSFTEIARFYSVSVSTISNVVKNISWKEDADGR